MSIKWDRPTLHDKLQEILDLADSVRLALQGSVDEDKLRPLVNEITRRASGAQLCKEKFEDDVRKIEAILLIADSMVLAATEALRGQWIPLSPQRRAKLKAGFAFMNEEKREEILRHFDDAA